MNELARPRLNGLDTLRALAVTLVVLHHYTLFVADDAGLFGAVGRIGWVGVDLFFALSGYLIGHQIFAAMQSAPGLSLRAFYARRLLRTLPNYLLVLALYASWPAFGEQAPLAPLWRYLSFTQNIGLAPGTAFSHSWSLAIEEQFYLLLPALALGGACLRLPRRAAWLALGALVLLGMLVRAALWSSAVAGQATGSYGYYQFIYYASWCRLDELLAGVALALLRCWYPAGWARLLRHANGALVAGLALAGWAVWLFLENRTGAWATVFGFPLLAAGFGLLMVAALAGQSWLGALRVPGAAALARWSYAIYLTHRGVAALAAPVLQEAGYGPAHPCAVLVSLLLSVLAGWLLYRLVEWPFMQLRARYVPDNLARASAPAA